MTSERSEVVWFEAETVHTIADVVRLSGLPRPMVDELFACGALPAATDAECTTECVVLARAAVRLREHFELDERGLAVAVSLLRRVRTLEARMATMGPTPADD